MAATARLLADGHTPSVDEIAEAADVSRRTVYMHFPTLEQLLLDAAIGALSASDIDSTLADAAHGDGPVASVDALAGAVARLAPTTLPLGRKIIRLTVDAPPGEQSAGDARRGYRRVEWIERAVEPLRAPLSKEQFDRLVSALSLVIGWEALIILRDIRNLTPSREQRVLRWAARALVESMLTEAGESTSRGD